MNTSRSKLLLLALMTALIVAIAPSSASAFGPKPTLTGIPKLTHGNTVTFTLTTTVSSAWIVDFECAYSNAPSLAPCDPREPTCTAVAGGQHTCSETITRFVQPGKQSIRFTGEYCEGPSRSACEASDSFESSGSEVYGFEIDNERPVVLIDSIFPNFKHQVTKPGADTFSFRSNEPVTYMCSFAGWDSPGTPCTSPVQVPPWLKNGTYRFVVYGFDAHGNRGAATRGFRVDVFHAKKCPKGSSKAAKAKRKKCVKKNLADKKAWKKKHKLK